MVLQYGRNKPAGVCEECCASLESLYTLAKKDREGEKTCKYGMRRLGKQEETLTWSRYILQHMPLHKQKDLCDQDTQQDEEELCSSPHHLKSC